MSDTSTTDAGARQERDQAREEEREQQELVRPPDLNQETDRSATRLELFFDLAFVLVVARCADVLSKSETWAGAASFAALMTLTWWAWASTTLHANRFDTDDVVFRVLTLLGMACVVGMAASVTDTSGPTGRWFAVASGLLRVVLVVQYARAWRHVPAARASIRPYLTAHAVAGVLWLVSAALPAPSRYALWALATVVDLSAPVLATRVRDKVPLHLEHLPERYGLLVILVLGEPITGIATGLQEGHWEPSVVVAAGLAFLLAVALWWSYFDLTGGIAKRRLLEEGETSKHGVHDLYLYAHLPLVIGAAGAGVGLEHAVMHAVDSDLVSGTAWVLAGGTALYLASSAYLQYVMGGGWRAALPWPGLGVPLSLGAALLPGPPTVALGALCVLLLGGLVAGVVQQRTAEVATAKV